MGGSVWGGHCLFFALFALLFTPAVWLHDSLLLLLYMYVWEDDRSTDGVYAMQCRVANDYGLYMIRVVRSIIDHELLKSELHLTRSCSCSCIEFPVAVESKA